MAMTDAQIRAMAKDIGKMPEQQAIVNSWVKEYLDATVKEEKKSSK